MHNSRTAFRSAVAASLLVGVAILVPHVAASAGVASRTVTQFGTLSNFDVFNDTGQETHGFEIELDGISASDVTYEFGAPYERYGNPIIVPFSGGVDVIYASPYDPAAKQFTEGTPVAPTPITATGGHECWTGGSANYPTAGCEHFGLSLAANPTNIVYHWLTGDPANPGKLVPVGGGVPIPAPQWSATPPAPNNPNPAPIVAAAVPAPEPDLGQQLGTAIWVKVYATQSQKSTDLGHLLSGDKQVPNAPSEVETEWLLIQGGVGGGLPAELSDSGQLGAKSESIARKYQFFQYTGPYDPENHEALPVTDSMPSAGELGNLIGNQMVALNLAPGGKVPGDVTPPKAYFSGRPAASTRSKSATFRFRATDNVSKKFTYFCSLDKKIPAPCKSLVVLRGLKVGTHTLSIYAIDGAQNPSKAVSYSWTVKK